MISYEHCQEIAPLIQHHVTTFVSVSAYIHIYTQHSVRRENELVIYMAPAMDENSLYAQFAEIRVKCLSRNKIKYVHVLILFVACIHLHSLDLVDKLSS